MKFTNVQDTNGLAHFETVIAKAANLSESASVLWLDRYFSESFTENNRIYNETTVKVALKRQQSMEEKNAHSSLARTEPNIEVRLSVINYHISLNQHAFNFRIHFRI